MVMHFSHRNYFLYSFSSISPCGQFKRIVRSSSGHQWINNPGLIHLLKSGSRFNRPLCASVCLLLEMAQSLLRPAWDWIVGCVYGQRTQWTLWDRLVFSGPWNIMFAYLQREFISLIHCFALVWGLKGFDFPHIYLLHFSPLCGRELLWREKLLLQLRSPVKWD